mmetsp:Transcript_74101/g.154550  ORF Transcript_74101/g.154550 Transcript_74101/m.154550 type:complete len:222 (-) Transcript_74101:1521-2186(-)
MDEEATRRATVSQPLLVKQPRLSPARAPTRPNLCRRSPHNQARTPRAGARSEMKIQTRTASTSRSRPATSRALLLPPRIREHRQKLESAKTAGIRMESFAESRIEVLHQTDRHHQRPSTKAKYSMLSLVDCDRCCSCRIFQNSRNTFRETPTVVARQTKGRHPGESPWWAPTLAQFQKPSKKKRRPPNRERPRLPSRSKSCSQELRRSKSESRMLPSPWQF